MSHSVTPASGSNATKTHTPPVKNSKTYTIIGVLAILIVGLSALTISWLNHENKKTIPISSSNTVGEDGSASQKATAVYGTYPAIEPKTFDISGEFSEKKVIPDGYYISFVCDQPYEVRKANGEIVQSQANKNAIIGLKNADESTENSMLSFRTTNESKTTMTIIFTPMKVVE